MDYYHPDFSKGYLSDKKIVFEGLFRYGFYAHIISAPIALLIGTFQAWVKPSKIRTSIHVLLGKIYTGLVLFIAAPGGLILSFYALGGWTGKISFFLLSVLWILFTWKGYVSGTERKIEQHQQYMIRSYVLLLSAVMLRLLLFFSNHYFTNKSEHSYALIAWLSWLPLLVIAELFFIAKRKAVL